MQKEVLRMLCAGADMRERLPMFELQEQLQKGEEVREEKKMMITDYIIRNKYKLIHVIMRIRCKYGAGR